MNHSTSLPIEILTSIFKIVSQEHGLYECAAVNRQFNTAINPMLWRTVSIYKKNKDMVGRLFQHVATSRVGVGRYIREIYLCLHHWTDTDLALLTPHVPNLEVLDIQSGKGISDASFLSMPQHCPKLQSLRLYNSTITHASIEQLGQLCQQLRALDLLSCCDLSPHTFKPLRQCPLEIIKIRFYGGASWMTADETAVDLALGFPQLKYLVLWVSLEGFVDRLLTLGASARAWPHLTHLSLNGVHNKELTDTLVVPFLACHRQLEELTLRWTNITDTTLAAMASYLPALVDLDVDDCPEITAKGLRAMIRAGCPQLMHIWVRQCRLLARLFPETNKSHAHLEHDIGLQQQLPVYLDRLDDDVLECIRYGDSDDDVTN